jgi:rod shape-determining protein MreC
VGFLRERVGDLEGAESLPSIYRSVSASVLSGWDGQRRLALVNRGREHGVKPGQGVVKGDVVLGRVLRADRLFSTIRFLTDPGCKVPVTLLPGGARDALGISTFDGLLCGRIGWGEVFELKHIRLPVPVAAGDAVLTSGRLGAFPAGLVAGRVFSVDDPDGVQFHEIRVAPEEDYLALRSVVILVPDLEAGVLGDLEAGRREE